MDLQVEKCVMVIDEALPLGFIANTAAVLGITLGHLRPEIIGGDVADGSGSLHAGITAVPVPILRAGAGAVRALREALCRPEFQEVTVVDFSDVAQGCKVYDEYIEKMAAAPEDGLQYLGLALCGPKKKVNKLTGSMPLLR